jgi:hypothetical protein
MQSLDRLVVEQMRPLLLGSGMLKGSLHTKMKSAGAHFCRHLDSGY